MQDIPSPLINGEFPEKPSIKNIHVVELCHKFQADAAIVFTFNINEPQCGEFCDGLHLSWARHKVSREQAILAAGFIIEAFVISPDELFGGELV